MKTLKEAANQRPWLFPLSRIEVKVGYMHTGSGRSMRTPQILKDILQGVGDRPDIRTREVSRAVIVPHSIVWRVLRDEGLHPCHVQKVQALIPADYAPRVEFVRLFLQQLAAQPDFSAHVLFTDESTFTREGISNTHNLHVFDLLSSFCNFVTLAINKII
ncbi:hypothetical protein AVEN_148158-1 [Araneus ventricosus]|uniref:Uncharacterized protein n=1 Tax=Araneus ventricosus TaxID=182803 RepID=A0A4Y2UDY6_ARAVE|nr:hypothetical protein AVEN_148158-1 [Araneus ventricosus]